MKKWLGVGVGVLVLGASTANGQEVAHLNLTPQDLSIVIQALGQQPYASVAQTIARIQAQVQAQIQQAQPKGGGAPAGGAPASPAATPAPAATPTEPQQ